MKTTLVAFFHAMPDTPIYSPTKGLWLDPEDEHRVLNGADVLAASAAWLGRESQVRIRLLTWARLVGTGGSVRCLCRERAGQEGWSRAQLYKVVDAAAARVADRMNEERETRRLTREDNRRQARKAACG